MSSAQQEEEVLGKAYDRRLMRRLLGYVRPYRWQVVVATVAALLQSATQVAGPLLNQQIIDRYLYPTHAPGGMRWISRYLPADPKHGINTVALLFLAILLLGFLLNVAQTYTMQWVGQHTMFDLRRQIFAHLQRLQVAFFDRNPVGRLVTRATNDVETINEMISSALVAFFDDTFVLLLIVVIMFRFNIMLALITLAILPLIFFATSIFRRAVRDSYRRVRAAVARINTFLQEHISGMQVVQAFNREEVAFGEFKQINAQHRKAWTDAVYAHAVYYPVVEILSTTAITLMIWFGGLRVLHGTLTIGVVFASVQYAQRFFRPIQDLSEKYNTLQSAMASSERIFKLLDTPVTLSSPTNPRYLPSAAGRVEFEHVWFAYHDEDWVLKDVSFTVEPGSTLAIVGHTGAGKTTIISLLLRFYDVQKGRILLDGIDIRELELKNLRQRFGIVLQDPYLFSGSIRENVLLASSHNGLSGAAAPVLEGRAKPSLAETPTVDAATVTAAAMREEQILNDALESANLSDTIASLPNGAETVLHERGAGLSTGQKQLVSFARALAANPPFLILDEATASVDTETELRIREALNRMVAGRTSIIIAHRLSTIQTADQILVMHKGTVRELGTHQELLHHRGIYWKLYRLQYKDQEISAPSTTPVQS